MSPRDRRPRRRRQVLMAGRETEDLVDMVRRTNEVRGRTVTLVPQAVSRFR